MQAKLTQRTIDALKPQAKPYSVRDTELKGFMLRVRPNGGMSWLFDYRNDQGRRLTYKIGSFPGVKAEGARRIAESVAGKIADHIDVQAEKKIARVDAERARVARLGTFIDERYAAWAVAHLRRGEATVARLRADFAHWLDQSLESFNTWRIEGWRRDQLKLGNTASTINRKLAPLLAALRWAVSWEVLEAYPVKNLKRLKVDTLGRTRFLTPAEEARLRDALVKRETRMRSARDRFNRWRVDRSKPVLPARTEQFVDHIRPLVLTALGTGMRRGELFDLRWSDVALDRALVTVRGATAKTGTTRHIPLNSQVAGTLKAWQKQTGGAGDDLVFPGEGGGQIDNITKAWAGLCKLAKISGFRFHDCRHHFASRLVSSGASLYVVQRLLGHSTPLMTSRYAHLSGDDLASAVAKLA